MTPNRKAKELFDKYQDAGSKWYVEATKECALIVIDEILKEIHDNYDTLHASDRKIYWNEVKDEINKIK